MKKLLIILFCFPIIVTAQYSNYYRVDANVNSNINQNVNINANVNKNVNISGTVTTIDYGALESAYAQQEANRLTRMQYLNQREKEAAIAIANDPSKAYDYGTDNKWKLDNKLKKTLGWDKKAKYFYHKIPSTILFDNVKGTYEYTNLSDNGVKTQIMLYIPITLKAYRKIKPDFSPNYERTFKYEELTEGELNKSLKNSMLHKKDIKRASVGGQNGFRGTLIWEDDYEKCITDNYGSALIANGQTYIFEVKVRYKGDKDEVTFEDLEGRKYYFRKLIDRMISTMAIEY